MEEVTGDAALGINVKMKKDPQINRHYFEVKNRVSKSPRPVRPLAQPGSARMATRICGREGAPFRNPTNNINSDRAVAPDASGTAHLQI